jgi:hypothetical protein
MNSLASINEHLSSATELKRLEFSTDMHTGSCTLLLELMDESKNPAKKVVLEALGVPEMSVNGFGGGITQILDLQVRYIGDLQQDRVRCIVEDVEESVQKLKLSLGISSPLINCSHSHVFVRMPVGSSRLVQASSKHLPKWPRASC